MNLTTPITIDSDVPRTPTEKRGIYHVFLPKLQAMKIGDSFFREGETVESVKGLIRYAKSVGIHLQAEDLDEDSIYFTAGVRVWRESQANLGGRKPAIPDGDLTYWKFDGKPYPEVVALAVGDIPKADGWYQIKVDEYQRLKLTCPNHVNYFYHPESESVWTIDIGEHIPDETLTCQIDGEQFKGLVAQGMLIDQTHGKTRSLLPTYWLNSKTNIAIEYLPGKRPTESHYTPITLEEYQLNVKSLSEVGKQDDILVQRKRPAYYRKPNGECMIVNPGEESKLERWPGAVKIPKTEYTTWLEESEL